MFPQKHKTTILGLLIARLHYLLVLVGFCVLSFATFLSTHGVQTAYAATSSTLNFQGRLYTSSGSTVPDGYYNVQFKLYDGGTDGGPGGTGQANAGTNLWTESYYDSNGVTAGNDNRLRVVNGYFSANLGSQTAFPGTINWDQELWLTMNVGGTTQTATPTYDGEMLQTGNTRTKLTGVPYAFRAGAVTDASGNAYTGDDLIQKAPGSVQSASSASSLIRVNQTGAGGLLQLQSGGSDAFTINNSGNVVSAGTGTFQGASLTVGTTSQSGSLVLYDGSSNTVTLSLAAQGQNSVITIPDPGGASDTVCLQGLNNCAGTGDIHQNGNSFGADVTIGSNDAYALNLETSGTTVASFSSTGAATFQNSTNSATAFRVLQGTTNASLFTIDSTNAGNISLLGNNSGETSSWQTNANSIPAARTSNAMVSANGYIYSLGGWNTTAQDDVYYAKLNANGSTGTWATAGSGALLPANRYEGGAAYYNGYIYYTGGNNGSGAQDDVYYSKVNADGTLGTWQTESDLLPATLDRHASAAYNGYLYALGGRSSAAGGSDDSTLYYAKLNADGSTGAWQTETDQMPANRERFGLAIANGYMYVTGGAAGSTEVATVYSAKLNTDGSTAAWASTTSLPDERRQHTSAIVNGYLYAIGGLTDNATPTMTDTVVYAPLNGDGTVGAWQTSANTMPATRSENSASAVVSNGYIYWVAGWDGAAAAANVYYTSTARVTVGGSLDLVGLSGENMSEGNSGGQLTAGNTSIVGTLNVQDQANFNGSIFSAGNFTNNGYALFQNSANSTTAFQIQNSAGTSLFNADTTNSEVTVNGGSGYVALAIDSAAGQSRDLSWRSAGVDRWILRTTNASESGSNAGSNFEILNRDDAGALLGHPLTIVRSNGSSVFKNSTDSTTAFQIQNAAGSSLFTADTTNKIITTLDQNIGSPANVGDAGRIFSDSFESGNFDLWSIGGSSSGTSTALPDTTIVRNGKFSARIHGTGTGAASLATGITGATTTTVRGYVYISSQGANDYTLLQLSGGGVNQELYLENSTGKIAAYDSANTTSYVSTNVPTTGAWHQIEMDVTYNATTGSITVYVDGTQVINQTNINTSASVPDTLYIGETTAGRAADVYFDDIVVDSVRPGDSASLYVADSLHVAGSTTLNGKVLVQPQTNSVYAFNIQDASRNNVFVADTSNKRILINGASNVAGETLTVKTGNAYGFVQTNGTVSLGTYVDGAIGYLGTYSNHKLQFFTNNQAGAITLNTDGSSLFKNNSDSATGFQIQSAGAADTLFTADTAARSGSGGNLIKIGNSTGTDGNTTILQVDSATADPTSNLSALNGGLFYNSTSNKISVIENGAVKVLCNTTDLGCGAAASANAATFIVGTSASGGASSAVASSSTTGADYVNASTTSAQTTINSALSALPATGGSVYLMEGTYIIDGSINIPNNTALIGAGPNTIIKLKNSNNAAINMITNSDTTTGTRVNIQDLTIDGNTANQTSGTNYGIYFTGMGAGTGNTARDGGRITNVTVKNLRNIGILLDGSSSNNTITRSTIFNNGTVGIYVNTSANNNTLTGNTAQGNGQTGIYVDGSYNTITGNTTQGNTQNGINLNSASGYNTVSGNTAQGNTLRGIYVTGGSYNTITGNTAQGNGNQGIIIDSTSNNTITGNTAIGNTQEGILLSAASNNSVTGNTSQGNSTGISLTASSNNNTVSANKIHDNGGATANNGLYISASDYNTITSNGITDTACTSSCSAINIANNTSDKNYLSNNRFSGSAADAASIADSGTNTIYANQQTNSTTSGSSDVSDFTLRGSSNSSTAFQIQNASGVSQFTADTTNGGLTLGSASGTGAITVGQSTASNTISIGSAIGAAATQTINIGTSATATSVTTLTLGSLIGTSTTTIQSGSGNINLQAAGTSTIGVIQVGAGGAGSTTPDYLALDVKSTTGDPAGGANGYMYYNTFDNKFRCYEAGAWKDCDTNTAGTVTLQSAYGNDADGGDSIIALTSADDSIIIRNPASGGTDSSYSLTIDQLSTGASGALSIQSAGTGNLLLITDTTATARDVLKIADGGATTFRNQTDSTGAFQVQNAAGSSLLNIDSSGSNITLLGNNSGELQAWQTNANTLTTTMSDPDSVVANGFIYTLGGNGTTTNYAKLNNDGSTGAFATTTALPASIRRASAVYVNGYIYVIGGYDGASVVSTVYYAKVKTDGTLGSWTTSTNALPAARDYGGAFAYNGYIYFVAGSDNTNGVATVYSAKTYANGSTAAWTTLSSTPLPANRLGIGLAVANGYVYVAGGKTTEASTTGQTAVYYAKINLDGTLGSWTTSGNALALGRHNLRLGVANGYLYGFAGRATAADHDETQYAALAADGSVGTWTQQTNLLPAARSGEAVAYANGYFYVLGGGGTNTVYYASTPRVKIAGSLDLVGSYGQTLADAGGAGSLTAGRTKILGSLEVQGQATFAQGLVVDKDLTVGGSAFFQNTADSTSAFIIQNSTGTSNLFVADTTNTRIGIGTSSPAYTLDVAGDINGQAIRDAIGWVQNQGGVEKLKNGVNNGGFGGGASVNKQTLSANDLSFFDSSTVNANSKSFASAIFDGRYIYFIPFYRATGATYHGQITRYDTTKDFSSTSSYTVFDTTAVNANSKGFLGAVFDGRYIYMIPYATAAGTGSGQVTRYDTQASFTSTSSYSVYDTTAVNASSKGFVGAVFDGRYLYMVPYYTGAAFSGQITRYDTTASFTSAGSYSVYDTTAVNANSKGFYGAVFDGRYIYFVPNTTNGTTYQGQVTRYDTTASFTSAGSYSVYDLAANVNASSKGFYGAVFDGRYIYYVPYATASSTPSGVVTRFDTTASFTSSSSYSIYDMGNVSASAKGFDGAFFDGKYVYFIPHFNVSSAVFHGNLARYDTSQSFTSASSYTVLNMASTNASSIGFVGGAMDGRYLYLSPYSLNGANNGQITRVKTYSGGVDTVNSINKVATSAEFLMNSNGSIYLQNNTDSTSAFKVLNTSGGTNLEVNNTYGTVGLGTTSVSDAKIYTSTGSLVGLRVNQTGSSDLLQLQNTGTAVFTVSSTGAVLSKNSTNSSTAFQIQNTAGTQLFNVDTSNNYVINNGISSLGNEVQNPSFEAGSGSNASGWDLAGGGTITTAAADAHTGNKYLQGTGNSTNHTIGATTKIMAVNPGDVIYYEGWIKNSAGANGTGGFYLSLYDKDMVSSGFSTGDTWNLPGTTYSLRTNRFTIPAGTYYIGLSATVRSGSTTGTWYFDDLYMKKSNEGSPILLKNSADSTTAFQIQNAAGTNSLFTADTSNGRIGINTSSMSYDLSFGGDSARTIGLQTRSTNAAGSNLTLTAGTAGTGASAFSGGTLTLQGGGAGGTGSANGGAVTIAGGAGVGSGTQGLVNLSTSAFTSASEQSFSSSTSITAGNVDLYSSLPVKAITNTGLVLTVPDPAQTAIGRLLYITARSGSLDFTLRLNSTRTAIDINMKANSTATLIWNGTDWTAAGASSSTDLQAAYNNTVSSAGGAELVLNASGGAADGLTVRNNGTTPIIGGLLEVQSSTGSNLFAVNNNATEYATNGGSETAGGTSTTFPSNTWSQSATGGTQATISRTVTSGEFATGVAAAKVVTTGATTANQGIANQIAVNGTNTALTANLTYTVAFTVKGTANFSTLDVVYSKDGTNTATTSCTTGKTVTQTVWTRIGCTFTAPSSGITTSNAIFIRQSDSNTTARTFYIDNLSLTVSANTNHAVDGSVDSALGTNWTTFGAGTAVTRDTTTLYDTSGSVKVDTTNNTDRGVTNNLTIAPSASTQYLVTFYAKLGSGTFTDIRVRYSRDGGTNFVTCADYNTQTLSTSVWTKITCLFTTDSTTATNADLIIDQPTAPGSTRTFYVDALSVTLNTNNANNVQIGGGSKGGPVTLFTLDRSAGAPIAANNDAYLGSMYYDTTTGRIQCYESAGWGTCGAPPDNIVNLNPEYAGAVLNGTGVGTMTADLCSNDTALSVNTSLCSTGQAKNFYKWTSPQATQQTYSIYVSYQLPSTFNGFSSDDTVQLVARVDNTTNASVTYQMFKSTGSAVTQCGSGETDVITGGGGSANTWYSYGINGNEATGCSFTSSSAGNYLLFKINLKANSNANAYVSTLSFTTTGR